MGVGVVGYPGDGWREGRYLGFVRSLCGYKGGRHREDHQFLDRVRGQGVGDFEGRHVEVVGGHEPEVWLGRSAVSCGRESA